MSQYLRNPNSPCSKCEVPSFLKWEGCEACCTVCSLGRCLDSAVLPNSSLCCDHLIPCQVRGRWAVQGWVSKPEASPDAFKSCSVSRGQTLALLLLL